MNSLRSHVKKSYKNDWWSAANSINLSISLSRFMFLPVHFFKDYNLYMELIFDTVTANILEYYALMIFLGCERNYRNLYHNTSYIMNSL